MKKRITNLHVSISPVGKFSTRIIKEVNSLIKLSLVDEVIIAEISGDKQSKKVEVWDNSIVILRFPILSHNFKKRNILTKIIAFVRIIEFPINLVYHFFKKDISIINCHYVEALPACVILKWLKRAKLIYDPHELECHKTGQNKANQFLAAFYEKHLVRYADHIIVVGDSINEWYKRQYNISERAITTIKNVPYFETAYAEKTNLLKTEFNIPECELVFLYQGLFTIGRAIPYYLNAFAQLPANKHLVLMGFGNLEPLIKEYAGVYKNIHWKKGVPSKDIKKYSSGADVGLCIIENISLSYYYSLPNKFFEYQHSNLPVIVSNFPDVQRVIEQYNCGWYIEPTENAIKEIVDQIGIAQIKEKQQKLFNCTQELSWDNEEKKYESIFAAFNIAGVNHFKE